MAQYHGEPLEAQIAHYRALGHPEHWGLWACGIIVWRGAQRKLGAEWLAQQMIWTSQDQISLPLLLRQKGVDMTDLSPGNVFDNPWFVYESHLKTGD